MAQREVLVRKMSQIAGREVGWVWPGRVPVAKLTLLAGECGVGKSLAAMDLAARVTRGGPFPPDVGTVATQPGRVLMLIGEDDVQDTVRPRLEAAGADLNRIEMFLGIGRLDGFIPFQFGSDLMELRTFLGSQAKSADPIRLIVIDPLNVFLTNVPGQRHRSVRQMLDVLSSVASMYKVAIILVTHLNKPGPRQATGHPRSLLHRTMGSVLVAAAARSVLMLVPDAVDPDRRLLLPGKSNITAAQSALAMRIQTRHLRDGGPGVAAIQWEPQAIPSQMPQPVASSSTALASAMDWLRQILTNGPMPVADLFDSAHACGISPITLRRAREAIGVQIERTGGFGDRERTWCWRWPDGKKNGSSPITGVYMKQR